MESRKETALLGKLVHGALVLLGATVLTAALFLVLPLLETIATPPAETLRAIDTSHADVPPPPAPPEPEQEPDKEPEAPPTAESLTEEAPPLDLSQLEMALNPVGGAGWGAAEFGMKLGAMTTAATKSGTEAAAEALFSLADLDQAPRAVHQPNPVVSAEMRKKSPGKVVLIFAVNAEGRVEEPKVQSSSDPVFERAALAAIKQWKFEPGKKAGRAVRFRMRVPMTF
jgi:protein TonB